MSPALPDSIDIHAFTQTQRVVSGALSSDCLHRLMDLVVGEPTAIHWSFAGSNLLRADGSREARAELTLTGSVRMACTRCLQALECALDEQRSLRFVSTESQAESEDVEDESFDVLVASRHFDLAGLIEDEILLALPSAPRHRDCPLPLAIRSQPAEAQDLAAAQDGTEIGSDESRGESTQTAQSQRSGPTFAQTRVGELARGRLGAAPVQPTQRLADALRAAQARREKDGAKD